jgi:hypothetical protein
MIYVSISRSIETKFREETGSFLMHFNCYICWWSAAIPRLDGQILSAYLTYSVVGFFHCLLWTQKEKKRKEKEKFGTSLRRWAAASKRGIYFRLLGESAKKKRTRSIDNTKLRRAAGRYMKKKKIQSIVQHICIDGRVLSWLAIKVNQSGGSLLFNSRYESKKKKIHKKKRHANRECIG